MGYEVTCGAQNSVNKTRVQDVLYRFGGSWVRINNGPFSAADSHLEVLGFYWPTGSFPDPDDPGYVTDEVGPHIWCCTGTTLNPQGKRQCQDPTKYLYWHNSQIPVSAACN